MSSAGSITRWINLIPAGNDQAATRLWDLYFDRIVRLARRKLGVVAKPAYDEEDVAISAFKSLFKCVETGRVQHDLDRDNLWRLLATITLRKVYDCIVHENRQKRSPRNGTVVGLTHPSVIQCLISNEPSPAATAQMEESFEQLLASLDHADLKEIAILKMEGYTNQEIADRSNRGLSTIERKLRTIRHIWTETYQTSN